MLAAASAPAFVKAESLMGLYVPKPYASGGFVSSRGTYILGNGRVWLDPVDDSGAWARKVEEKLILNSTYGKFGQFEAEMIRKIAVGMSIPFAELTKEFTLINEPAKR